ncbi:hypothetical protein [Haloarchaeobius sp. DFWS5]|uniref:hypothetical protein n=1 Tax=Haloarchaeobius sp. DFWS5 TaxID=3446114 RepID=UPI003EB7AEEF
MTFETKTFRGTVDDSQNGTELDSFTPGSDELWYVDVGYVLSTNDQDADSSDPHIGIEFGVQDKQTSLPAYLPQSTKARAGNFNGPDTDQSTAGVYLTDEERLVIQGWAEINGGSATAEWFVKIRRVL